jgi:thiol-disulfide isomerase/thioredoxin
MRTELRVEVVRTDRNLAERCAELLPKGGERVQDQRFAVPVDFQYRADHTDEEIRQMADIEYQKRLQGQEVLKRLTQPIEALVGKQAPALSADGWVGGPRPDLTGKPYLLHFWATWCGPCKNDLPLLKTLAEQGIVIVGLHPPGTPIEEVEKAVREQDFGSPTWLATGKGGEADSQRIGDYPAGVYPYYILVDAQGRVAAHGHLSELLDKVGVGAMVAPRRNDAEE